MNRLAFLCLVLATPTVTAGAPAEPMVITVVGDRDAEWGSYRQGYQAVRQFERITRTRPLIQAHMQIQPLREDVSLAGVQVELAGETTRIPIALDGVGRATIPMLRQAYDEDALLRLNRRKGNYRISGLFTIRERDDGRYGAAELRAACEQMLSAQREAGNRFTLLGKQCAGVKFIYALGDSAAAVDVLDGGAVKGSLAGALEAPFTLPPVPTRYRVLTYRFADWPPEGTLAAHTRPVAISALYK
jgi:hypothetical protein